MLVEHARNLAGLPDASHAEYGPAGHPVITLLACSLLDQTISVEIASGSVLHSVYGRSHATEKTTCSYGLALDAQHIAGEHGMAVSATDDTGEVRAVERTDHPYFVATLFQPQLSSAAGSPHPVFVGLLLAANKKKPAAAASRGYPAT